MTRQTERKPVDSLNDLIAMLEYRRPANSKSERRFINRFLRPFEHIVDGYGNIHIAVGDAPTILWSAHTDTVHKTPGRQRLIVDAHSEKPTISVAHGECLGADDGAGCWLLREMILAGVPGHYIFHREEESGGCGSSWLAKEKAHVIGKYKAAIAFDRRGTHSIITHQWGGRCCSDTFAKSLAVAINLPLTLDDGGSFTDTASYTDLIGECTNVSVGYSREHSSHEELDLLYLFDLRDAMVAFDETKLSFERKPGEVEEIDIWSSWGHTYRYTGSGHLRYQRSPSVITETDVPHTWRAHEDLPLYDQCGSEPREFSYPRNENVTTVTPSLQAICRDYPMEVADFLEQFAITEDDLWNHVSQVGHGMRRARS